ncbi:MAG: hypothetical protein PHR49_01865 [Methanoculleus sp.]|uniref:Uncharacterized protein n=1 Tax=Methanoculleus palmolei TaxID=72612 RepID=A0ABD8ACM9_9EURY|nr:hypothetical protein [Methanoculleus sp.]WOX56681.1 hypothetical protein R6Y95_00250 [Methanoculleus palmolei]
MTPTDDLYLLGSLNSKVADYVVHLISSTKQGGYYEYKPLYLSKTQFAPSLLLTPPISPAATGSLPRSGISLQ